MQHTFPSDLTDRRQWIIWNEEQRDGNATKVPYSIHGGHAKSTDPETWGRFSEALEKWQGNGYAGIGFVFAPEGPFCGVDLDHCRDPDTGHLDKWAARIVARMDSYTELSPSGTGLHIICKADKPGDKCKTGNLPPEWNAPEGAEIEIYDKARYFTVTGERLEDAPATPQERQDALKRLYRKLWPKREPDRHSPSAPARPADLGDRELLEKARNAENGDKFARLWRGEVAAYTSHSEADQALCNLLAFWTGGDRGRMDRLFRESELCREKWTDRPDYRKRTIDKALEGRTDFYAPQKSTSYGRGTRCSDQNPPENSPPNGDTGAESGGKLTIAEKLLRLTRDCSFFRTRCGRAFGTPPGTRPLELTERGGAFKRWLSSRYLAEYDKPPRSGELSNVVSALAARALTEGESRKTHIRTGYHEGCLYVDLGHKRPRCMRIAPGEVSIETDPPVAFEAPTDLAALPDPDLDAGADALHQLHELLGWDREDTFLAVCWMLSTWQPPAPYPALLIEGGPGSGKSTAAAILRYLVDPAGESGKLVARRPRTDKDLAAATSKSHVLALDNLSSLPEWLSDHLAGLATGSAHLARKLYTDAETVAIERTIPMILNGVSPSGIGGDLRDRIIPILLSKPDRKADEKELWAKVHRLRPRIMGALAKAAARALAELDRTEIPPDRRPRMLDATRFIKAGIGKLREVYEWQDLSFLDVFEERKHEAATAETQADPVAAALIRCLKDKGSVKGTATELQQKLVAYVPGGKLKEHKKAGTWPDGARRFGRHLSQIEPQLEAAGIICGKPDRRRRRTYSLANAAGE